MEYSTGHRQIQRQLSYIVWYLQVTGHWQKNFEDSHITPPTPRKPQLCSKQLKTTLGRGRLCPVLYSQETDYRQIKNPIFFIIQHRTDSEVIGTPPRNTNERRVTAAKSGNKTPHKKGGGGRLNLNSSLKNFASNCSISQGLNIYLVKLSKLKNGWQP